jgi:hypothetical protein
MVKSVSEKCRRKTMLGQKAAILSMIILIYTTSGRSQSSVKTESNAEGVLEVLITDADSNQPIEKASVSVKIDNGGTSTTTVYTGRDGIARFRLKPEQYHITSVYKQGFTWQSGPQEIISIEVGETVRIEGQLAGKPKIRGTVTDPNNKPIKGVVLRTLPLSLQQETSDSEGKFEVTLNADSRAGMSRSLILLIARYAKDNLAAAVQIKDDTTTINIRLQPALTLTGRVVDPNNNFISGAQVLARLTVSGSSMGMAGKTDAQGKYRITGLPAGQKYNIVANADGYGRISIEVDTADALNNQFEVNTLTLLPSDRILSGMVVDEVGKPVANARVSISGDSQLSQSTQTDAGGKFSFKVSAGMASLSATSGGTPFLRGSLEAMAGQDVKIVIKADSATTVSVQRQPSSLVGKILPDLNDLSVRPLPDITDKIVLACFFDYEQRPSRNCITQLATRAKELKEKGIEIVAIQASKIDKATLDKWVKDNNITFPFGMLEKDEEQKKLNWGVKALPWLILTDKQHKVTAEGFAITEIDGKIKVFEDAK